jgi:hypothetical protein
MAAMLNRIHPLVLASVALLLGACTAARPPAPSGFLGGNAGTAPLSSSSVDDAAARQAALAATGIAIDPVVFVGEATDALSTATERERLAGKLRTLLQAEFGRRRPLAEAPGAGVLRLRAAVTRLCLTQPVVNAASELLVFVPVARGGIAVEFELVDADGRRVASLAAARNGSLVQTFSALRRTGHAEAAFAVLARDFADSIGWPVAEDKSRCHTCATDAEPRCSYAATKVAKIE